MSETSYAVTGEHHGSIVFAKSKTEAVKTFRDHYNGEKVIHVRDRNTTVWP